MDRRRIALSAVLIVAAVLAGGCYQELAVRDFSKAGQQNLEGWHLFPFSDVRFTQKGMALGRATFSVPLELGSDFQVRIEFNSELEAGELTELGICLSNEKVYMSPLGSNIIIRTEKEAGSSKYEAYSVRFVVRQQTYASGAELLPGFKAKGMNALTVWRKGSEYGWKLNGKKSEALKLPSELTGRVYMHLNVNAGSSSDAGLTIVKVRASGPKGSAYAW